MSEFISIPQGWQCPVCKRVYSPTFPWCTVCGNEQVVTTTSIDSIPSTNVAHTQITDWMKTLTENFGTEEKDG